MGCGTETGGGAGHDPESGGIGSPSEGALTRRPGLDLGSRLPLTLDLSPDSANFWVSLGQIPPTP